VKLGELAVEYINGIAAVIAVLAFSSLVVDVSAAVFFRYVLNDSLVWAEEMARYLFVWITFIGGGLGVAKNIHVGVDSLVILLPNTFRKLVVVCVDMAIVIFLVTLIVVGAQFVRFGMSVRSLLIDIPMGYVYMAVPAGGMVMLANMLLALKSDIAELIKGETI
jgi:TRAP-type C4-dicarboxylate transport system permease small subunit